MLWSTAFVRHAAGMSGVVSQRHVRELPARGFAKAVSLE